MIAEEIIIIKNDKDGRTSSLTIKTVFFSCSNSPSTFFLPTVITAKGIYPPSLYPAPLIKRSLSVPTKLITMTEHQENIPLPLRKSLSEPIIEIKPKPIVVQQEIPISPSHSSQIPRPIRDPIPTQVHSTPVASKKKKKRFMPTLPSQRTENNKIPQKSTKKQQQQVVEEDDEPMTKPLSLAEKRKRQAKRADQVKIWKVREEREAREARLQLRRQMMNVPAKKNNNNTLEPSLSTNRKKKKKKVKFNFDRNCIIQLPLSDQEQQQQ